MATDYPRGIDVASYQGAPDWAAVAADGVTFALIKATQGTDYVNEMLVPQSRCREAGLYRGFYHFARPDNNAPIDEAAHFLNVIMGGLLRGDLFALDLEDFVGSLSKPTIGANGVESWAYEWLSYVEARTSVKPLLYVNGNDISAHGLATDRLHRYPLWLASWQSQVPLNLFGWQSLTFWQTGVADSQAGIIGSCDQDRFIGRVADIPSFGWQPGGTIPEPTAPSDPTVPDGIFAGLTLAQLREKAEGLVNAVAYLGDNIGDRIDNERTELSSVQTTLEAASAELRRVREESAGPRPS